jgi:hypothetical protein
MASVIPPPDAAAAVADPPADAPRPAPAAGVEALTVREWTPGAAGEGANSDAYLAGRLAAASADYKGVALTTFILGATLGAIGWLACGVLVEHWLVVGGLPRPVRWAWLGAGLVGLAAAALRWLLPLVRYRVNLVYAARQIEREHPELHNDLVNTVLVRARPAGSAPLVVTSLKRRTARQLADVAADTTIDRTMALRLAYALLAAVTLVGLYELLAPKSLLVSGARLLAPWIGWAAPSRVQIDGPRLAWRIPNGAAADDPAKDGRGSGADPRRKVAIDGGRAVVVRGRQLETSAAIRGLRSGEEPVCRITPLNEAGLPDPYGTPWKVAMRATADADGGGRLYTALLPDAARGLDRSLAVALAAGDSHTEPVRVSVVDAPSLLVREVRYDFPPYTRRGPETAAWQGDLRALEETLATLTVEANQPLDQAWIDFRCDGQRDLKIKLSGTSARHGTVSFPLRLNGASHVSPPLPAGGERRWRAGRQSRTPHRGDRRPPPGDRHRGTDRFTVARAAGEPGGGARPGQRSRLRPGAGRHRDADQGSRTSDADRAPRGTPRRGVQGDGTADPRQTGRRPGERPGVPWIRDRYPSPGNQRRPFTVAGTADRRGCQAPAAPRRSTRHPR